MTRFMLIMMTVALLGSLTAGAQEGSGNWRPDWTPKQGPHAAEMIGPLAYLPEARDWERLTVWIPKQAPADERLPCIIHVYGGGYANKGCPRTPGEEWLKRGFVVAQPDYMLRAHYTSITGGWDIMHAIRYLRANAERFRIDPERIGIFGLSAGGWIVQNHCYADDSLEVTISGKTKPVRMAPLVPTERELADIPVRVQAAVSDWGAYKLAGKKGDRGEWGQVSADDPALMTCFKGEPRPLGETSSSIGILQRYGIPAEAVFLGPIKSTHVPDADAPGKLLDGSDTTWYGAVGDFFERHVKHPTRATAPELHPHGGPIAGPTDVQVLSVHGPGSVRYTLDGSEPTTGSAVAGATISVAAGQTLKAIAVRSGLEPSRIATATFVAGKPAPVLTTEQRHFDLQAGEPFSVSLTARAPGPVVWSLIGRTTVQAGRRWKDREAWITIDVDSGELSAPKPRPGNYTVYVVASPRLDKRGATADFRSMVARLHFSVTE